jgi:hypothetical protein
MKRIFILFIIIILFSCTSLNEPIIIDNIPQMDLSADSTDMEYYSEVERENVKLKTYIDELINQIKHKIKNIIDLRGEK